MSKKKRVIAWSLCLAAVPAVAIAEEAELSLADLMDIQVTTASKTPERQSDAPGIMTVVSRDEISRYGGLSLLEVLNRVPGLSSGTNYFTDRSLITARGDQVKVTSGHVLLLIDGRPVREVLEGGISTEILESFPLDALERIEVIKGPGSVLYGSDAFSAVINLISINPDRATAKTTVLAGPDGQVLFSGNTTAKVGDLGVVVSARRHEAGNTELKYKHKFRNGTVKSLPVDEPNEGNGAFASVRYKDVKATVTYADWRTWNNYDGLAINSNYWSKTSGSLGYSLSVLDGWSMEFQTGLTASIMRTDTLPFAERFSYDAVAEWTNFIRPMEKLNIVAGALVNQREGEAWKTGTEKGMNVDSSQLGVAAYAQVDYRPIEMAKLIAGLQLNKFMDVDLDYAPRLGLVLNPLKELSAKVLYSQAYRAPSINELALNVPTVKGNSALKPEKVSTTEGSLAWQGEQFQVMASGFYSEQSNIIRSDLMPGSTSIRKYYNLDKYTIYGAELEGKAYVTRALLVNGSLLWQQSKDGKDSVGSLPTAEWTVKGGLSYDWDRGLTVSVFDRYQTDYGSDFSKVANPAPSGHNILSLHAKADPMQLISGGASSGVDLVLKIDNLLDETYWVPEWGGRPLNSLPGTLGRTIYGGLSVSL